MSSEKDPIIEEAFRRFDDMAVGDIERAFDGGAKVGAFILTFVAIDCLATWCAGDDSSHKHFEEFIEDFFPEKYKVLARDFYTYLRCGLVHNYSTKTSKYALQDGHPLVHLKKAPDGTIVLNWEDLFSDFLVAKEKYYKAMWQSEELQDNLRKQIARRGPLQVRRLPFSWLLDAEVDEVSTI